MEKSRGKWPLAKTLRTIFLIVTALGLCLFLAAGLGGESDAELRLMGIHEDRLVMLLESSGEVVAYYKDLYDPDSIFTRADSVPESGNAFFLDGGRLGVAGDFDNEFDVYVYPFDIGLECDEDRCPFEYYPEDDDKLVFANIVGNEYIMYILSPDGSLRYCETFSEPEEDILLSDVSFLDSTQGGWVYAYSDGILRRWTGSDFDSCEEYENVPCPERLVGEDLYIDEAGSLILIWDGVAEEVEIDSLYENVCFRTDGYIIAADNFGEVYEYELWGFVAEKVGTAEVDGEILGLIEDYALVKKEDQLYLEELAFHDPDIEPGGEDDPIADPTDTPTPTPTPTPAITPTPTPTDPDESEEPTLRPSPSESSPPASKPNDEVGKLIENLKFRELVGEKDEYVIMAAGARVSDLRKIYWPLSIDAYTKDGGQVFECLLKTGMKIHIPIDGVEYKEVCVVILGDCDGDGQVTKDDLTFAALYIVNAQDVETEAQFCAMDMNGDGEVTIWDIPPLAYDIERII